MAESHKSPLMGSRAIDTDPFRTDPPLLKTYSQLKTYKTSCFEYADIRIFFRPHAKTAGVPKTAAVLPLLVCIPGLGGSVAQFYPLLSNLVDLAPCLSIDYPGGGCSRYTVTSWGAYTSEALAELLEVIIEDYRDKEHNQGVVLIGHSMGTALVAQLASYSAPHKTSLVQNIKTLVAICPSADLPDEQKSKLFRRLLWIPGWIFALWRVWDSIGGPNSQSVSRLIGKDADEELKLMQHRFNQQSRTPVWRRMAYGLLPKYEDGKPKGGLPGLETWAGIEVPVYLIAGEDDHLTPPAAAEKILQVPKVDKRKRHDFCQRQENPNLNSSTQTAMGYSSTQVTTQCGSRIDSLVKQGSNTDMVTKVYHSDDDSATTSKYLVGLTVQAEHAPQIIQLYVMPAPANHMLLYAPECSETLARLISEFLARHVTQRLSLAVLV